MKDHMVDSKPVPNFYWNGVFAMRPETQIEVAKGRNLFGTGKIFETEELGEMVSQCNNNLCDFVTRLKHADVEAQRLVLGTALTNANPGQDFDLHIGSNLQ